MPYLRSSKQNSIDLENSLNCSDCRNLWLQKQPNLLKQIHGSKCSNGHTISNPDRLKNCKNVQLTNVCVINKTESVIHCGGKQLIAFELKNIFKNYSKSLSKNEKNFKSLYLNNTSIEVLEENSFYEITFDTITIENCQYLTTINRNAFNNTLLVTKTLNLISNPKLTSPGNSIFGIFNQFKNIESISMKDVNITEIPSNAFNGQKIHLKVLTFQSCSIKKIVSGAFFKLKNLESLQFLYTCLSVYTSVPENAFSFDEKSEKPFELTFDDYFDSNTNIFNEKSLVNIKRPTKLVLRMKPEIQYLDERVFLPFLSDNVFLPFLRSNGRNKIMVSDCSWKNELAINCSDCRNKWLLSNYELYKRVNDYLQIPPCSNRRKFDYPIKLFNCPDEVIDLPVINKNDGGLEFKGNFYIPITLLTYLIMGKF